MLPQDRLPAISKAGADRVDVTFSMRLNIPDSFFVIPSHHNSNKADPVNDFITFGCKSMPYWRTHPERFEQLKRLKRTAS
jgi:hypothetical protein